MGVHINQKSNVIKEKYDAALKDIDKASTLEELKNIMKLVLDALGVISDDKTKEFSAKDKSLKALSK